VENSFYCNVNSTKFLLKFWNYYYYLILEIEKKEIPLMSRLDAKLKGALEGFLEDWTMDCKYSHSKGPHDDSQNGNTQQPTWHGVFFFGEIFAT
jgi:hypothetical protein